MADPRERWNDQEEAMRIATDRHLGTVWTALPVRITEDSDGHICKAQSTIKGWQRNKDDGSMKSVEIPHFGEVPINFPAGGGLTITHPVKEKDEGLAIFASRCIDGWWEKGGVQEEPYRRRHSLSDAILIPGVRNKPRQLDPPPSTNSVQIRTDDGKFYIELHQDGTCNIYAKAVNVHAPRITMDGTQKQEKSGGRLADELPEPVLLNGAQRQARKELEDKEADTHVEIKGWLHVTKDIDCDQNINAKQNITADQTVTGKREVVGNNVHLSTHRHTAVQGGTGISGPPQSGS